jgi:tRNA modification GTPase
VCDEDNTILDEAILLNFNAPKSYTGEDVIEFSVHSGLYIMKKLLRRVLTVGARLAEPGEFTKRAFLNQKLDLTQAESVAELISATTKQAHIAAVRLKQGALYKKITLISQDVLTLVGHVAAFIDYPEEEVATLDFGDMSRQTSRILEALKVLSVDYESGKAFKEGIPAVIVGKPNVGKSTIINRLVGCDLSIVTDVPGTTRDVIEENINLGGILLNIADTAGIRYTGDVVERIGVERALQRLRSAGLVLVVFDASRPLDEQDEQVLAEVAENDQCDVIAVINKIDLPIKLDIEYIKSRIDCVVSGSIKDELLVDGISKVVQAKFGAISGAGCVFVNERQHNCISRAIACFAEAQELLYARQQLDVIGVQLEKGLTVLHELSGQNVSGLILDDIFGRFCVGK